MAKKLADLTVDELYDKPRITPTVEKVIKEKDDFSKPNHRYCGKVCRYCHKNMDIKSSLFPDALLKTQIEFKKKPRETESQIDLVILQDSWASKTKFQTGLAMDKVYNNILRQILEGVDPAFASSGRWCVLSTLRCPPVLEDEKISDSDIKRCSPYVLSELERIKPKVILCLGSSSSKVLGCNKSVYTNRGEIVNSRFGPVVHSIHPKSLVMLRQNASGAMWGPDYYSCLEIDVKKAVRIAKEEVQIDFDLLGNIQKIRDNNIRICETLQDVKESVALIHSLPTTDVISFDTETTGLDPFSRDAKILCVQFGWMDAQKTPKAVVIPLWHRENTTIDPNEAWKEVTTVLVSERCKAMHNGKFDIKYIYVTTGIRVINAMFDTMLLLHELNSGIQGNYGLKRAAWDYLYHTGIAGYEDLLPELTKEESEEDGSTEEESTDPN